MDKAHSLPLFISLLTGANIVVVWIVMLWRSGSKSGAYQADLVDAQKQIAALTKTVEFLKAQLSDLSHQLTRITSQLATREDIAKVITSYCDLKSEVKLERIKHLEQSAEHFRDMLEKQADRASKIEGELKHVLQSCQDCNRD